MRITFLNAIFFFRQYVHYLPAIIGKAINWPAINYANFKRKHVKIKSIKSIEGEIYVINNGLIEIGHGFCANSGTNFNPIGGDTILRIIAFTPSAQIIIGNDVGISNSTIFCFSKIEIGDGVMIGGGVKIWDSNFHSLDPIMRTSDNDTDRKTAPVKICERAFIGSGSMILKGVTIGKNSVIAAGSVVVKDIPDNVIAGGNPCKIIKQLTK